MNEEMNKMLNGLDSSIGGLESYLDAELDSLLEEFAGQDAPSGVNTDDDDSCAGGACKI